MKNHIFRSLVALIVFGSLSGCSVSGPTTKGGEEIEEAPKAIIPLPAAVEWGNQNYILPKVNRICYNEGAKKASLWMERLLNRTSTEVVTNPGNMCGNINLVADPGLKERLGDEGYILNISNNGIVVKSAKEAGLFYGIQSLRQLLPSEIEQGDVTSGISIPHVVIEDKPEFAWRGTMVDVARSFFGLDYLKRHADRMALYKMNRLHLHLTDDQGWRIEIKGKPKLTEIGSKGSVRRGRSGFLTQEEYKELQDYALARNIIIVPEIDMPGHIYAALAAYPELNCDDYTNLTPKRVTPPEMFQDYNVGWSKLCLEKPEIYNFVSEVIGQMADITKGPWIHIGGDEIDDPRYKEFVVKADSLVQTYGKTTIGWEEVTQAEVSPNLISQVWRGTVESVVKDIKVIHSLCSQFYYDHANIPGQENTNNWCKKDGVSLEDTYKFVNDNPNLIGVEAPVWSEFVLTDEMMDNRFWPRAIAAAEVGWTPGDRRDFQTFKERLGKHGDRMRALEINFFRTPGIDWGSEKVVPGAFSNFNLPSE